MSDKAWQCRPMVEHSPEIHKILFQSPVPQEAGRRRRRRKRRRREKGDGERESLHVNGLPAITHPGLSTEKESWKKLNKCPWVQVFSEYHQKGSGLLVPSLQNGTAGPSTSGPVISSQSNFYPSKVSFSLLAEEEWVTPTCTEESLPPQASSGNASCGLWL